jgi:hypothetical protein
MQSIVFHACTSCGKVRKAITCIYSEDAKPYCKSYKKCNENHPYHPSQVNKIQLYSVIGVEVNE